MTEIMVPVHGIRACVREIDDAADQLAGIRWPTIDSETMTGSAVRRVVTTQQLAAHCHRLVADLRSWTATACVAVAACEQSDLRTASALA